MCVIYYLIVGCKLTLVFIEFVTKQFSFVFWITRIALSASFSGLASFTIGCISASEIMYFLSMTSNLMMVLQSKLSNSILKFSAIAKKVVTKQLLIAAA